MEPISDQDAQEILGVDPDTLDEVGDALGVDQDDWGADDLAAARAWLDDEDDEADADEDE